MRLIPAAILASGEGSAKYLREWHETVLPSGLREVIRICASVDELQSAVEFSRSTRSRLILQEAGLEAPSRPSLHLVVVADVEDAAVISGQGQLLDGAALAVARVEDLRRTTIFVDRLGGQGVKALRAANWEGIKNVPWLVSRVCSNGFWMEEADVQRKVTDLLTALLLLERPEGADGLIWSSDGNEVNPTLRSVRLLAFLEGGPEALASVWVEESVPRVLNFLRQDARAEAAELRDRASAAAVVRGVRSGRIPSDGLLQAALGPEGLAGWPAGAILAEGPQWLRHLASLLTAPGNDTPEVEREPKPRRGCLRLLSLFGGDRDATQNGVATVASLAEKQAVSARLNLVGAELGKIQRIASGVSAVVEEERPYFRSCADSIMKVLRVALCDAIHSDWDAQVPEEEVRTMVRQRLQECVEDDLPGVMQAIASRQSFEGRPRREGSVPILYAGMTIGNEQTLHCLVGTHPVPSLPEQFREVKAYRGVGPRYIGASWPVPVERLRC